MTRTIAAAFAGGLLLAGCSMPATTQSAAPPVQSGFLGASIYARMHANSGPDRPAESYVNPNVDIGRYNSMIVEPVQFWRVPGAPEQLGPAERQMLTDAFYAALRTELAKDFRLVSTHGPRTIVIATAITAAEPGANPALAGVATFVPQARLLNTGVSLLTGSNPLTGSATGEIKITDSETGELLGAAIDRRDATMGTAVRTSSWQDVHTVTTYWAQLVRFRICQVQARPNCQAPAGGGA